MFTVAMNTPLRETKGIFSLCSFDRRRVWVYRNADENFKGKQVLITQKEYPNFETLLVKLGNIVPTVAGDMITTTNNAMTYIRCIETVEKYSVYCRFILTH